MDLDLDTLIDEAVAALPRGRRGGVATPPTILREIKEDDLPGILARPAPPPGDSPIKRLRNTHHLAARCLAEGRALVETAEITGYTPARLGQLKNDPTFQELLAYYKGQTEAKWLNVHERLASLAVDVQEELQARLDESPETFTNEELRRLGETLLDRSGFGPSKTQNLNVKSQSAVLHLIEQIKGETQDGSEIKLLAAE